MRCGWVDWPLVAGALVAFLIAVSLRTIDGRALVDTLPMGTHWLWHSFGAAAVQFLVLYIWRSDLREARARRG